jgi:L-alanine-DL-glutamate epimerase-like enolase superfamily enzyme
VSARIARIEGVPYSLPLHGNLAWGKGSSLSVAAHVLVRVYLDDGTLGQAEAPPRPTIYGETQASVLGTLKHLEPALVGLDIAEARRVVAAGVRVLKVKVGRDHAHDLRLITELRAEYGDAVQLYADSNETLTPDLAPAALEAMRGAGLRYVEEPLPVRLLRERAGLRALGILPIIGDDSCFTPADLERELSFGTIDILNIKTARNGFTDSLHMLSRAREAGVGVMIGSQASTGLGTLHAALMASQAGVTEPSELSFVLKLQDDLLTGPLEFVDGWLDVAALAGLSIDEAKLKRYRQD